MLILSTIYYSIRLKKSWHRIASHLSHHISPQLLIVDDASADRTTEVALEYTKRHLDLIRVLTLGENHGKGGAVKLGVQRARGKYILMVRLRFISFALHARQYMKSRNKQ